VGVDLCLLPGLNVSTGLEFIAEIGTDMSKWKNHKHFAAWLNLAPNSKISGGKVLSSKAMRKKNRGGQILKQAASTLSNSKTPLGDYYRKMRARLGGKGAVTASAHKIARTIYAMLQNKKEFSQEIITGNEEKYKEDKIKKLEKQIAKLKAA
jgi:transposase